MDLQTLEKTNVDVNEEDFESVFLSEIQNVRIAVLGSSKVGKTSIVSQFLLRKCPLECCSTSKPILLRGPRITGTSVELEIVDTPSKLPTNDPNNEVIPAADAYLLVYAINDADSFEYIAKLKDRIMMSKYQKNIPIIVAGNKADLEGDRKVLFALADCLVSIDWELPYKELTAKDRGSVDGLFQIVCECLKLKLIHPGGGMHNRRRSSFMSNFSSKLNKLRQRLKLRRQNPDN